MTKVAFYHLTREGVEAALPKLAEKMLSSGMRGLIKCTGKTTIKVLDQALWTYKTDSFLPHAPAGSEHDSNQPLLLTLDDENSNNSNALLLINKAKYEGSDSFDRVMVMFDGHDADVVTHARTAWKQYKGSDAELSYWQQKDGGGWEQKA